jgi:uncharacterized protein (UPF0261 family)
VAQSSATVVLLGTFDTKGDEYAYVKSLIEAEGVHTVTVDVGILGVPKLAADVPRAAVATKAGADLQQLIDGNDRGTAVTAMAEGARRVLAELWAAGSADAVLALGGTGGTTLAAHAFRDLPIGVPKVIVSTVASGATQPYIGESDLILMPSVVDVSGVNRLSAEILANAAAAVAGMARRARVAIDGGRRLIAASMFGVTTPCVERARSLLEEAGDEVMVFHMTGAGGRSMERLIREGHVSGVLDVTTTELADELVGGVFSAGPGRLTAAAAAGIPQVVSVGALDMVNFGARDTVPAEFESRRLLVHNASVTLMRTTPEECAELGARLARRVSASSGPVTVVLPLRGVSAVSAAGGPFHDPDADAALFAAIRSTIDPERVDLVELDAAINDPIVAETMTSLLLGALADRA